MQIEQQIREFIIKNLYYTEDNPIADEDSFLETGVVDSMGVMELVAFVQSGFGVDVAQHEIVVENFDSIRKLANFVRKKLLLKTPQLSIPGNARLADAPFLASQ
jgi:acyl carrier protein